MISLGFSSEKLAYLGMRRDRFTTQSANHLRVGARKPECHSIEESQRETKEILSTVIRQKQVIAGRLQCLDQCKESSQAPQIIDFLNTSSLKAATQFIALELCMNGISDQVSPLLSNTIYLGLICYTWQGPSSTLKTDCLGLIASSIAKGISLPSLPPYLKAVKLAAFFYLRYKVQEDTILNTSNKLYSLLEGDPDLEHLHSDPHFHDRLTELDEQLSSHHSFYPVSSFPFFNRKGELDSFISLAKTGSDEDKKYAARELLKLSSNHNNHDAFLKKGGIEVLVALANSGLEALEENTLKALLNVTFNHDMHDSILKSGGIEVLLRLAGNGSWNADLALINLSNNPPMCKTIAKTSLKAYILKNQEYTESVVLEDITWNGDSFTNKEGKNIDRNKLTAFKSHDRKAVRLYYKKSLQDHLRRSDTDPLSRDPLPKWVKNICRNPDHED